MAAILSRPLCVKQERPFQGLLFIYEGISIAKTGTTDLRLSFRPRNVHDLKWTSDPSSRLSIKMLSYQYMNSNYQDKMVFIFIRGIHIPVRWSLYTESALRLLSQYSVSAHT